MVEGTFLLDAAQIWAVPWEMGDQGYMNNNYPDQPPVSLINAFSIYQYILWYVVAQSVHIPKDIFYCGASAILL